MAHYFESTPTSESNEKIIKVFINDTHFTFYTDNDVFSKKGLDFGTRTLLESVTDITGSDILDLGCGYGPIGIYMSYLKNNVDMIDINSRAVELSKKNASVNKLKVNAFTSNMYENVTKEYDYIISNPPIRVGNEILYKLLFDADKYLKNKGHLIIVINKDQGAKTVAKKLEEIYDVSILNKNKGFFVIDCQKRWQFDTYLVKL